MMRRRPRSTKRIAQDHWTVGLVLVAVVFLLVVVGGWVGWWVEKVVSWLGG